MYSQMQGSTSYDQVPWQIIPRGFNVNLPKDQEYWQDLRPVCVTGMKLYVDMDGWYLTGGERGRRQGWRVAIMTTWNASFVMDRLALCSWEWNCQHLVMFYSVVWIISLFLRELIWYSFISCLIYGQAKRKRMTVSRAKRQKNNKKTQGPGVHGTQTVACETPCKNTLDPCSSAHISSRCPSCCDSDGKDPYYFDRL